MGEQTKVKISNPGLERILNEAFRQIHELRQRGVVVGGDMRAIQSGRETIVEAWNDGGGQEASSPLPWDIFLTGEGTPDPVTGYATYKARVFPGLVAGAMPSNMFELFTGIPKDGFRYLIATVTTDGRGVISCAIGMSEATAPSMPAPELGIAPLEIKVVLGVVLDHVAYNVWGRNVSVASREAFREDKPDAGPHELPYQSWWNWTVY